MRATLDFASGTPISVNDVIRAMARVLDVNVTVRHEGHVDYLHDGHLHRVARACGRLLEHERHAQTGQHRVRGARLGVTASTVGGSGF